MKDNRGGIVDFPLRTIPDHELPGYLEPLKENCGDVVTSEELLRGAILAKSMLDPFAQCCLIILKRCKWNTPSTSARTRISLQNPNGKDSRSNGRVPFGESRKTSSSLSRLVVWRVWSKVGQQCFARSHLHQRNCSTVAWGDS